MQAVKKEKPQKSKPLPAKHDWGEKKKEQPPTTNNTTKSLPKTP